jgi:hypothetical protein
VLHAQSILCTSLPVCGISTFSHSPCFDDLIHALGYGNQARNIARQPYFLQVLKKMEAVGFFERFVNLYQIVRCHIL